MEKLGIDYETVRRKYPGMIYVSISGYGQHGRYAGKGGHDLNYQALGAVEPKFWREFCSALDREDLVARKFGGEAVIREVADVFRRRSLAVARLMPQSSIPPPDSATSPPQGIHGAAGTRPSVKFG